jgi:hypothetical protein
MRVEDLKQRFPKLAATPTPTNALPYKVEKK